MSVLMAMDSSNCSWQAVLSFNLITNEIYSNDYKMNINNTGDFSNDIVRVTIPISLSSVTKSALLGIKSDILLFIMK